MFIKELVYVGVNDENNHVRTKHPPSLQRAY
jgi:hypothetical protein